MLEIIGDDSLGPGVLEIMVNLPHFGGIFSKKISPEGQQVLQEFTSERKQSNLDDLHQLPML